MNHKERFRAIMEYEKVDRIPVNFFGTWEETQRRWRKEGCPHIEKVRGCVGPQLPEMDPDWESGLWNHHGLVNLNPVGNYKPGIIEEDENYIIIQNSIGEVKKDSKKGDTISHTLRFGLEPNRESWERFKSYMSLKEHDRWAADWEQKADKLNAEDRLLPIMGGSLYGQLRNWMGIEAISLLMYDDPGLFDEMISYMTDYYINGLAPLVKKVKFDFVYLFEDCCGADGPLFSPELYTEYFDAKYRKIVDFFKSNGITYILLDSDGKTDRFIPLWLASGINIFFPLEVGKWKATPSAMRKEFGTGIRFFGGIDKNMLTEDKRVLRDYLYSLKPSVTKGGYLPCPDHRIQPSCSYPKFLEYLEIFKEVFC